MSRELVEIVGDQGQKLVRADRVDVYRKKGYMLKEEYEAQQNDTTVTEEDDGSEGIIDD